MISLLLNAASDRASRVLCLGAHCDDIEIGCGGTLWSMASARPRMQMKWCVFSGERTRSGEAERSAEAWFAQGAEGAISVDNFTDGYFPSQWADIKRRFEAIRAEFEPDVIFTHHHDDSHQDHRVLHELTWNTFRNHLIFEYEIPKYEGDLSRPGVYVPLDERAATAKIELLMKHFATQQNKYWFTEDTFRALMRLRGIECRAPSGFAEAFHCRKLLLQLPA